MNPETKIHSQGSVSTTCQNCKNDFVKGCENEFETSYSPDRLEIIYCEKCYQSEVI